MMRITRQVDLRANIRKYFDLVSGGEVLIVPRKDNQNIVIISERDYQEMLKTQKNLEYAAKLQASREQIERGQVIIKTMDELEKMGE